MTPSSAHAHRGSRYRHRRPGRRARARPRPRGRAFRARASASAGIRTRSTCAPARAASRSTPGSSSTTRVNYPRLTRPFASSASRRRTPRCRSPCRCAGLRSRSCSSRRPLRRRPAAARDPAVPAQRRAVVARDEHARLTLGAVRRVGAVLGAASRTTTSCRCAPRSGRRRPRAALDFPARYAVRSSRTTACSASRHFRWRTVTGGSRAYVRGAARPVPRARAPGRRAGRRARRRRRERADRRRRRPPLRPGRDRHPRRAGAGAAGGADGRERRAARRVRVHRQQTVLHTDAAPAAAARGVRAAGTTCSRPAAPRGALRP